MNDWSAIGRAWQILALAGLALIGSSRASAQTDTAEEENESELPDVVVTATRLDKALDKIPAGVGAVNKDDVQLAQQQLGLDESLVKIPGLFMQNRYNFAQDLRISIRGFGSRAAFGIRGIKILVDGIPETLPDGQGQVDSIDLGSVQNISVIRGPSSSLYGNASGGVIDITSEEGPPQPFIEPRFAWGDYGYQKYQLKAGGRAEKVDYFVNVSEMKLDGYREHSQTESSLINGRVRFFFPNRDSDLNVSFNAFDQPIANDPGSLTRQQAEQNPQQARAANVAFDAGEAVDQQRVGFVYNSNFGPTHQLRVRNYYVWRKFNNRLPFVNGGSVDLDRFFVGGGVSYINTGNLGRNANRLIAGIDLEDQDDERKRFDNNMGTIGNLVFEQNENVSSVGIFAHNEFSFGPDLGLTLGLRHDRLEYDVVDRFVADGDQSGTRTFEATSPMIGVLYSTSPSANVYINISNGFETPTTTELANPDGSGGFNPTIEPQKAENYEIGVKGDISGRHRYQFAVFHIDVKDELIPFEIPGSPGRDFFVNAGKSRRDGMELAYTVVAAPGLELSFAYTYSDFVFEDFVDDNGNDFNGNKLPGQPDNLLHGEISYLHGSGFFTIFDVLYVDEFFVNNANTETNPASTVANLRIGYTVGRGPWMVEPFIGIVNMFDESYNQNVRINAFGGRYFEPGPPRNFFGGLRFRYDFGL